MNRTEKVIKALNDYDNLIKKYKIDKIEKEEVESLRDSTSILVGELKRFGCRRLDNRKVI
jgi:hypothetical protein